MSDFIHVLAIPGSLRERSYNRALLQAASELLPDTMTLDLYDLAPIPMFNSDLERGGVPDAVQDFHQRMVAADALLIATPEYNFSIPGVLKNAIDWASRPQANGNSAPLNFKPAAILSAAGRFGGVRAQGHLHDILLHNQVHILQRPQFMLPSAGSHFDDELRLRDEETRLRLQDVLVALEEWTRRLQPVGVPA
jgi:chromate reductase